MNTTHLTILADASVMTGIAAVTDRPTTFPVAHTLPAPVAHRPLPPAPPSDHIATRRIVYVTRGAK